MLLMPQKKWQTIRIVLLTAGIVSISGVILGVFIHPYFLIIPVFVGSMQTIFALTGFCAMAVLLSGAGVKQDGVKLNSSIEPMKLSLKNARVELAACKNKPCSLFPSFKKKKEKKSKLQLT